MDPRRDPGFELAEKVAASDALGSLVARVGRDEGLQHRAAEDPAGVLREAGIELPDELRVQFTRREIRRAVRPTPDWMPFTLELTNCRTYWIEEEGQPPRQETVCFGFEIVPNRDPGGPPWPR